MLRDEIIRLRKQKMSVKSIQKVLGCSRSTVSKWCALVRENKDIIDENLYHNTVGTKEQLGRLNPRKERELDLIKQSILLQQKIPENPNWNNIYKNMLRKATKAYLVFLFGGSCQICNYKKCHDALGFHHIDPVTKRFQLGGMCLTYNLEKILREAKKCVLLCNNCHTEIHVGIQVIPPKIRIPKTPRVDSVVEWYLAHVAQLAEHGSLKTSVAGSIPVMGTTQIAKIL